MNKLVAGVKGPRLWLYLAVLALAFSLFAVAFAWWYWRALPFLGRAAVTTAVAAVATLVDAVIAGGVAVAAFNAATQTPDLVLLGGEIGTEKMALPLVGQPPTMAELIIIQRSGFQSIQIELVLWNRSKYTAQNPAILIHMAEGAAHPVQRAGWTVGPSREWALWEGAAVHGTWQQPITYLELTELSPAREVPHGFRCEVVAEGFRRDFVLWIKYEATT